MLLSFFLQEYDNEWTDPDLQLHPEPTDTHTCEWVELTHTNNQSLEDTNKEMRLEDCGWSLVTFVWSKQILFALN
jgi:hypothetical protein